MTPLRRLRLQTKGAIYVLLLITAIFLAVALVVYSSVRRDLEQQIVAENLRMVRDMAASARSPILTTNLAALRQILEKARGNRAVAAALFTDSSGKVVASTDLSELGQQRPAWATASRRSRPEPEGGWLGLTGPTLPESTSHPIRVGDSRLGSVHVRFRPAELRAIIADNLGTTLEQLLWLGLLTGIVGTAGAFLVSGFVTRPIRRLTTEVEAMERELAVGPGEAEDAASSGDELDRLQSGFHQLRYTLDRYLSELDQLHQKQQALNCLATIGEMSAHVAHELRNSLSSLRGAARYLQRHPEAAQQTEFTSIIEEEVQRLYEMTEGFLDFSRPFDPQLEERDLCALAEETYHQFRTDYDNAGVALAFSGECPRPTAVDPQLLHQALVNLLGNALDMLGAGDRVELRVEAADGDASRIVVRDTGPGIPDEERHRIFKPFVTNKDHGSGLGLAVVSKIALQHGGQADVANDPEGGARFTLILPRSSH